MEVRVTGIAKAATVIGADWPTHILSIINDAGPGWGATSIAKQHNNHEIFNFHDVENDEIEGLVVPSKSEMTNIIETLKSWDLTDAKVLIHCTAGKSRSTAVAITLLVMKGAKTEDAIRFVNSQSPAMFPNRLMIQLFDEILGLNGALLNPVLAWYDEKILIIPGLKTPNRGGYNR